MFLTIPSKYQFDFLYGSKDMSPTDLNHKVSAAKILLLEDYVFRTYLNFRK